MELEALERPGDPPSPPRDELLRERGNRRIRRDAREGGRQITPLLKPRLGRTGTVVSRRWRERSANARRNQKGPDAPLGDTEIGGFECPSPDCVVSKNPRRNACSSIA